MAQTTCIDSSKSLPKITQSTGEIWGCFLEDIHQVEPWCVAFLRHGFLWWFSPPFETEYIFETVSHLVSQPARQVETLLLGKKKTWPSLRPLKHQQGELRIFYQTKMFLTPFWMISKIMKVIWKIIIFQKSQNSWLKFFCTLKFKVWNIWNPSVLAEGETSPQLPLCRFATSANPHNWLNLLAVELWKSPWKINVKHNVEVWKMIFHGKWVIFRFHDDFQGCSGPFGLTIHISPLPTKILEQWCYKKPHQTWKMKSRLVAIKILLERTYIIYHRAVFQCFLSSQ